MRDTLRLLRNHGMNTRDEIKIFGHNSRLDSVHAAIGLRLIKEVHWITDTRIANARRLDKAFADLSDFIQIPKRPQGYNWVYHTYVMRVKNRDTLLAHLLEQGIRAKIHYPIPMHLQEASIYLGYKQGDFPVAEEDARTMITLPVHQHLTDAMLDFMIQTIRSFYLKKNNAVAANA
jgi:dTDP-4-amino-4,6-dideoxygalactose transaminase